MTESPSSLIGLKASADKLNARLQADGFLSPDEGATALALCYEFIRMHEAEQVMGGVHGEDGGLISACSNKGDNLALPANKQAELVSIYGEDANKPGEISDTAQAIYEEWMHQKPSEQKSICALAQKCFAAGVAIKRETVALWQPKETMPVDRKVLAYAKDLYGDQYEIHTTFWNDGHWANFTSHFPPLGWMELPALTDNQIEDGKA